jgi:hypothetical protein
MPSGHAGVTWRNGCESNGFDVSDELKRELLTMTPYPVLSKASHNCAIVNQNYTLDRLGSPRKYAFSKSSKSQELCMQAPVHAAICCSVVRTALCLHYCYLDLPVSDA